jgi:thiamine monophosphate kinase
VKKAASGAELQAEAIPRASVGKPLREVDLEFALHGGEDYELLFTAPRGKRIPSRIAGIVITHIGQITRGRKIFLTNRERCWARTPATGMGTLPQVVVTLVTRHHLCLYPARGKRY